MLLSCLILTYIGADLHIGRACAYSNYVLVVLLLCGLFQESDSDFHMLDTTLCIETNKIVTSLQKETLLRIVHIFIGTNQNGVGLNSIYFIPMTGVQVLCGSQGP